MIDVAIICANLGKANIARKLICLHILHTFFIFTENVSKCYSSVKKEVSLVSATVVPAACLLAVTFVKCDHIAVVASMAIAVTAMGGMFSGVLANHIDIASQYAGIHLCKSYYTSF
jgi:hypothetical protein